MNKHKVYITNKGAHDFSPAEKFGDLVYLTVGSINKYDTSRMYRTMAPILRDSSPDDFLLATSLSMINMIAVGILATKHGKVNFLLYDVVRNRYFSRTVSFTALLDPM